MKELKVTKHKYATNFGGLGFHNNDATMYHIMDTEHFNQFVCKCYREVSPGFMRTFAGFYDWTKEAMDEFAEYYEKMQKWTDTPMYLTPGMATVHFSEEDMKQYAEGVAEKLAYLYYDKGVKHIRYYCFSNELSQGMYAALLNDLPTFKKYHEFLFTAFQRKNLPVGLLATDATEYKHWNTVEWAVNNMANISEDYCVHIYERAHDVYDLDFYDFFYEKCSDIVNVGIRNFGKRVILGEVGAQKNEGQITFRQGTVVDTCRYFYDEKETAFLGIMLTEMAFAAINAGIYAIAYWSFLDHPSPFSCAYSTGDEYSRKWGEAEHFFSVTADSKYNQWGFMKWEDNGDYRARAHYYAIAPLVKFFKKNSKVLDITADDPLLRCCGIQNRDGSVSVGIVNRNDEDMEIKLSSSLFSKKVRVYEYDTANVPMNDFCDMQEYIAELLPEEITYTLKANSITYFTTDYEEKSHSVYADGVAIKDNLLSWLPVNDTKHCYYRVFASECADFEPQKGNQIASTVATELPINDSKLYYKVISVDRSGNM